MSLPPLPSLALPRRPALLLGTCHPPMQGAWQQIRRAGHVLAHSTRAPLHYVARLPAQLRRSVGGTLQLKLHRQTERHCRDPYYMLMSQAGHLSIKRATREAPPTSVPCCPCCTASQPALAQASRRAEPARELRRSSTSWQAPGLETGALEQPGLALRSARAPSSLLRCQIGADQRAPRAWNQQRPATSRDVHFPPAAAAASPAAAACPAAGAMVSAAEQLARGQPDAPGQQPPEDYEGAPTIASVQAQL